MAFERMTAAQWWYGLFVGCIVLGLLLYLWAVMILVFNRDQQASDVFGLLGTGLLSAAAAIFFFFLSSPEPRHGRRR